MTTLLAPIEGAVFAECETCGSQLMVEPGQSIVLEHHADGSHGYDPRAETEPKNDPVEEGGDGTDPTLPEEVELPEADEPEGEPEAPEA